MGLARRSHMRKLILSSVVVLLAGSALVADATEDTRAQKRKKAAHAAAVQHDRSGVDVHVVFSTRDVQIIRTHYAPRYRKLPPGLRKKLARTGTLPPGWQKKMEPFPAELERDLVVLPREYRRGVLDGHAVIYRPQSQVIVDVAVLF